ncbi:MAG: hypothetical protein IJE44_03410 [Clostridia bacterium]|nr:hypothetical protein [Clostridia bacterium]MBQ6895354.1 hypothetical protein [Clostridia bacterium]
MINTVTGKIKKRNFGTILIHEHIRCASNDLLHTFGEKWHDEQYLKEFASKILCEMRIKYGLGLWVDGTPIDLGRDYALLREVSENSGVFIVASTGLYHFPSCYTADHSEQEIASWFIDEYRCGMEGSTVKPGILKGASDVAGITKDNAKRLKALAIAQEETGLPLYVHSNHKGKLVDEQLGILLETISNPEKIIIGHAANRPDAEYLERILDRGCYIAMDQCHCAGYSMEEIGKTLVKLIRDGYEDKILLSNDLCIYTDFGTRKNTGFQLSVDEQVKRYGHLFNDVYQGFCEAGGSESEFQKMLSVNPVAVLDV